MTTMGVINRGTNRIVIDLSEMQSARLMEQAVRARASIVLRPKVAVGADMMAVRLIEIRADSLVVTVDACPDLADVQSAYCDATLLFEGQEYLFSTNVMDSFEGKERRCLELSRPLMLQTWQRRRFVRATVADSARIFIGEPGRFDRHDFEGAMLNVCPDGLACRVDERDADCHEIGELVGVSFVLESTAGPIELNASIKGKTPGATGGTVILGMQFEPSERTGEQEARLAEALELYT